MTIFRKLLLGVVLFIVALPTFADARSYRTSPSDVYVGGYYRSDGTYVRQHYRSAPDGITSNNYSCIDYGQCGDSLSAIPSSNPVPVIPSTAAQPTSYMEEDVIPTITKLSRNKLTTATLTGKTTITVYGTDLDWGDYFKLNGVKLKRRYLGESKVQITIPFSKLKYKTFSLRFYHKGKLVSSKKIKIQQKSTVIVTKPSSTSVNNFYS